MGTSNEMVAMQDESFSYNQSIFNGGIEYVEFEDTELPVLIKWNDFLNVRYGDWKTPIKYTHEFKQQ